MSYTVGCVPYVNAVPLVAQFERWGERSPVKVIYDVPAKLPALLDSGEADAILVSSVDALRVPGRRMAANVCIGSHGAVKSVRMFSKVPFSNVRSLALDASSMTSNRLAQIVLEESYGAADLGIEKMHPNLDAMLEVCDACVLIGDIGMTSDGTGLYVADLGSEWRQLTGKPFVWAAWIGGERLTPELAMWLETAKSHVVGREISDSSLTGQAAKLLFWRWYRSMDRSVEEYVRTEREILLDRAMLHAGWSREMVEDYFTNVMVYDMDEAVLSGMHEFQKRLLRLGFSDCVHFPAIVGGQLPDLDDLRRELTESGQPLPDWLLPPRVG